MIHPPKDAPNTSATPTRHAAAPALTHATDTSNGKPTRPAPTPPRARHKPGNAPSYAPPRSPPAPAATPTAGCHPAPSAATHPHPPPAPPQPAQRSPERSHSDHHRPAGLRPPLARRRLPHRRPATAAGHRATRVPATRRPPAAVPLPLVRHHHRGRPP